MIMIRLIVCNIILIVFIMAWCTSAHPEKKIVPSSKLAEEKVSQKSDNITSDYSHSSKNNQYSPNSNLNKYHHQLHQRKHNRYHDNHYGYHPEFDTKWKQYKEKYNRRYANHDEEENRKKIFNNHLRSIMKHNHESDAGLHSYRLDVNEFSDLTDEEYRNTILQLQYRGRSSNENDNDNSDENNNKFVDGSKKVVNRTRLLGGSNDYGDLLSTKSTSTSVPRLLYRSNKKLLKRLDWRWLDIVPPVRNQGSCGACWAFTTVTLLESQLALRDNKMYNLSVQNLIDCTIEYGNVGCKGGLMSTAYEYIIANKGIALESEYPYEGTIRRCRDTGKRTYAPMKAFAEIESFQEPTLAVALNEIGPIAVAIDASSFTFRFYKSGIYDDPYCSEVDLNHGMVLIGYNTDIIYGDYWILQNSWGKGWGEDGYARMRRHVNLCGIATLASFPILDQ